MTEELSVRDTFFVVRSSCGRTWEIQASQVRDDYADFLKREDGLSEDAAKAQADADPNFLETWFCEQWSWQDVETFGTLVKEASAQEVKSALDYFRNNAGQAPAEGYTMKQAAEGAGPGNPGLESTRERFEEAAYAKHFMSTVARTGLGGCLSFMPDPARTLTKAELCERDGDDYKRPEVSAMWWGWQAAMGGRAG